MPSKESQKRIRRTKSAIDKDVLNAVNSLVEEIGFSNITLTAIAQKAKIESPVFYRRYKNLDDLFNKYTEKYDFWFSNIARNIPLDKSDDVIFKSLLTNLSTALYKSKGMQQLLIWELADDNKITRKTAELREKINEPLIKLLESRFSHTGININVLAAILISGIYYLILHRKISTFCNINFASKAGKEQLNKTINDFVDITYKLLEESDKLQSIANKLRAEGISEDIIQKCIYA